MARFNARTPEPWEWQVLKTCRTCGKLKPWAQFSPHSRTEDGRVKTVYPHCKQCVAEQRRELYAANSEQVNARRRAWYAANREQVRMREALARMSLTEEARARERAYRARYREAHREQRRAYQNEWARRKWAAVRADRANAGPLIPAAPFVEWIKAKQEEGWRFEDLADHAGITQRSLSRLVRGEAQKVRLDVVDRLTIALGEHLDDVIPFERAA